MALLDVAIRAGIAAYLRGLYVGMPGRLEAYDQATRKATVKPLIQEPNYAGVMQSLKPIVGVPVMFPGGAAAGLSLPLEVGDTGWLSFSHRSMELWLARGGDQPPGDPRVMDMTDAVFWPGLRPFSAESLDEEADALVLRNGRAKVKIRGDKLALGNDVAELLDLFDQFLTQIQGSAAIVVSTGTGIGGLNPITAPFVAAIQTKLGQIKGTL